MQKVRRWWPRDCGTRTDLVAGLISEKHPHCSRQAGGRASELLFVSFSWAQRSHTAETSANEEGVRGERTPQSQTLTPKPSWTQMCRWSEPCHIWTSQGPCGLYLSGSNELSLPWQLCPMPGPRSYVNTIISTLNCQAGYWETWVYRGHCTRKFLSPFSSAQFPVQVWPCPCVSESMACSAQCIPEPDYSKRTQEKSRQFSHFKQFDPFSLKSLSKQKLFFFLAPVTSVWCWKKNHLLYYTWLKMNRRTFPHLRRKLHVCTVSVTDGWAQTQSKRLEAWDRKATTSSHCQIGSEDESWITIRSESQSESVQ